MSNTPDWMLTYFCPGPGVKYRPPVMAVPACLIAFQKETRKWQYRVIKLTDGGLLRTMGRIEIVQPRFVKTLTRLRWLVEHGRPAQRARARKVLES